VKRFSRPRTARAAGITTRISKQPVPQTATPPQNLALIRALERIQPYIGGNRDVVFSGADGVGKRYHARLTHDKTRGSDLFLEVCPETGEELLRAQLFGEDKKRLQGKYSIILPALTPRTTLFVKDIDLLSILQLSLISRFLIERDRRGDRIPGRIIVSTALPWPSLLRKLPDSLAHSLDYFELCEIPSLRERFDELPSLVETFLASMAGKGRDPWRVTAATYEQLRARAWRDNLTELKYVIQSAAAGSPGDQLQLPDFPGDEIQLVESLFAEIQAGKKVSIEQHIASLEKGLLQRVLVKCKFDQRKAARMLSMTEPNMSYRIKKFGIFIPPDR
jgi:Nif-specific regulatory protein